MAMGRHAHICATDLRTLYAAPHIAVDAYPRAQCPPRIRPLPFAPARCKLGMSHEPSDKWQRRMAWLDLALPLACLMFPVRLRGPISGQQPLAAPHGPHLRTAADVLPMIYLH